MNPKLSEPTEAANVKNAQRPNRPPDLRFYVIHSGLSSQAYEESMLRPLGLLTDSQVEAAFHRRGYWLAFWLRLPTIALIYQIAAKVTAECPLEAARLITVCEYGERREGDEAPEPFPLTVEAWGALRYKVAKVLDDALLDIINPAGLDDPDFKALLQRLQAAEQAVTRAAQMPHKGGAAVH